MGLDWCLRRTDGVNESVLTLLDLRRFDKNTREGRKAMQDVIDSHRSVIKTELEGVNKRGVALQLRSEYVDRWSRPDDEIMDEMDGHIDITSLDEHPEYADGTTAPLERSPFTMLSGLESFRGKRIQSRFNSLVPSGLDNELFSELDQGQMNALADRLESCLPTDHPDSMQLYSDCLDPSDCRQLLYAEVDKLPDDDMQGLMFDIHDIKTAIRWLRFWADYPVKMVPWF